MILIIYELAHFLVHIHCLYYKAHLQVQRFMLIVTQDNV